MMMRRYLENVLIPLPVLQELRDARDGCRAQPRSLHDLPIRNSFRNEPCCFKPCAQCYHLIESRNIAEEGGNFIDRPALQKCGAQRPQKRVLSPVIFL